MQKSPRYVVVRLMPDADLRQSLQGMIVSERLQAASIVSAVGSLKSASFRLGSGEVRNYSGRLELVSLSGTLAQEGMHIHASIACDDGIVVGGHLIAGCSVNTTIELVLCDMSELFIFDRVQCERSGFKELTVTKL